MVKVMPIFNTMDLKIQNKIICHYQSNNELGLHPDSARLCDTIDHILPINEMQKLIVEKVFYNLRNISNFNCDWIKDQLLLYICRKDRVGKNKVVHTIELGCTLLSQDSDLVITTPTSATADNIDGSTIYTGLVIDVRNRHKKLNAISNLWTAQYIMIVNEISTVKLEILSNMGKQLAKARGFSNSSKAVFRGLSIVIVMADFY